MRKYSILRDLSRARTAQPFDGGPMGRAAPGPSPEAGPRMALPFSEPKIEVGELSKREVRDVARDPEVQAVAPVIPTTLVWPVEGDVGLGGGQPETAATATWGVSAVRADLSLRSGAGAVVAVLDTGIDATHPAFTGATVVEQDFSGSGNGDVQGHGTHCAGTIFGRDVEGLRIGVAPGVERALVGKVLGDDGRGDSEMLFRGIQWAAQEAAHVVSMSLGFDFPGLVKELTDGGWPADLATSAALEGYRANLRMFDALMQMVRSRAAFGAGTVVVAAAGNESQRNVDPDHEISVALPAAAEGVVSVGALGQAPGGLDVAYFSNTFPQVSAPGVDVLSAAVGGGLRSLNGTSMATPHVAGVAALWWEDVLASPLPPTAAVVTARLLAHAVTDVFAAGVDVADRGSGLVRAP